MKNLFASLAFLVFNFLHQSLFSQSSDELFVAAKQAAFETKNYDAAKQYAYQALRLAPAYSDVEIFLGRVFTWNKEYDSARFHFTNVLGYDPANEDACVAFADLEYWNEHYQNSLNICEKGLAVFPGSTELQIRKIKNLAIMGKSREALVLANTVLLTVQNNPELIALAEKLKLAHVTNTIGIAYELSAFDKQYANPWHLANLSYKLNTGAGSFIARVNYANRFGANGLQGEVDAYPRISKTFYSYLNVGLSNSDGVFPRYRAGVSLYANLPHSLEAEAGIRYLYFSDPTFIYTASLGKYYRDFLFTARTYLAPNGLNLSQSYSLTGRYYFGGSDDYALLSVGTGISPDESNQSILIDTKRQIFAAHRISAGISRAFLKWYIFNANAGIINQEYQPGKKGNQFNLSLGLSRRF